ncbi:MAG: putative peptidoglycan glycosyltransferase FtsW [bacterium]|nr:putative peptidoglycan glycosyltransferase FtsW [bacterium]
MLHIRRANSDIIIMVGILLAVGIVMVYSSSVFVFISEQVKNGGKNNQITSLVFLRKQLIPLLIGIILCIVLLKTDYHLLGKISWVFLGITVCFLIAVLVFGPKINGVHRWIKIGGVSIQPSEFVKIALIIFIADFLSKRDRNDVKKTLLPLLGVLVVVGGLIALEPSFGILSVICMTCFVMLFMGGVKLIYLAAPVVLLGSIGVIGFMNSPKFAYAKARVTKYVAIQEENRNGSGKGKDTTKASGEIKQPINYQLQQSLYGIGAGGFLGKGLGEGKAKLLFLPYPHTDFIFSIISEEAGLLGGAFVCIMFLLLFLKGVTIAWGSPDEMGKLLAVGISFLLFISATVHICVACGILPTTGVPLPFISFGGSNLLASLMSIGILLNISLHKDDSQEMIVKNEEQKDGENER